MDSGSRPRAVIISASFGAGHDGAATELTRRLQVMGFGVDRHDFVDLMPRRAGVLLRGLYRRQLTVAPQSWGWFLTLAGRDRFAKQSADATAMADRATLSAVGSDADLVLSTYPLASQVLGRLRRTGRLAVPVVTYLTDMSVHRLWVADGIDVHLALHEEPARQAKEHGATDVRVIAPAVDPAFGVAPSASARARWGLPRRSPLALLVAGAWGVGSVARAAADIAATGLAVPVVACGRNDGLRQRLRRAGHSIALGWVDDMASLMHSCQIVVQNAGGLSSLEALSACVPVVTYRCLPGHGRTNATGLEQAGWVPWIRSRGDLTRGLSAALSAPSRFVPAAAQPETVLAELAGRGCPRPARPSTRDIYTVRR
jgi:UDP-N-acetylglucosamine:LPS N-acetylglucosamine transferase